MFINGLSLHLRMNRPTLRKEYKYILENKKNRLELDEIGYEVCLMHFKGKNVNEIAKVISKKYRVSIYSAKQDVSELIRKITLFDLSLFKLTKKEKDFLSMHQRAKMKNKGDILESIDKKFLLMLNNQSIKNKVYPSYITRIRKRLDKLGLLY